MRRCGSSLATRWRGGEDVSERKYVDGVRLPWVERKKIWCAAGACRALAAAVKSADALPNFAEPAGRSAGARVAVWELRGSPDEQLRYFHDAGGGPAAEARRPPDFAELDEAVASWSGGKASTRRTAQGRAQTRRAAARRFKAPAQVQRVALAMLGPRCRASDVMRDP